MTNYLFCSTSSLWIYKLFLGLSILSDITLANIATANQEYIWHKLANSTGKEVEEKYQKKPRYMGDSDSAMAYLVCQGLKQLKT